MTDGSVSLVVACRDQEASLPVLLDRIARMRTGAARAWEVLLVDDGSKDGTFGILLDAARTQDGVRILRHDRRLGIGAALRTGVQHAEGRVICTMEAGGPFPPERLAELVERVDSGAAVVTGVPRLPGSDSLTLARVRSRVGRVAASLYERLAGEELESFTCPFRAYRGEVVRSIRSRSNGHAALAETMLRAKIGGHRIEEVPIVVRQVEGARLDLRAATAAHLRALGILAIFGGARRLGLATRFLL